MAHKPIGCFSSYKEYEDQFNYARDELGDILICENCGEKIKAFPLSDGRLINLCKKCYERIRDEY